MLTLMILKGMDLNFNLVKILTFSPSKNPGVIKKPKGVKRLNDLINFDVDIPKLIRHLD